MWPSIWIYGGLPRSARASFAMAKKVFVNSSAATKQSIQLDRHIPRSGTRDDKFEGEVSGLAVRSPDWRRNPGLFNEQSPAD